MRKKMRGVKLPHLKATENIATADMPVSARLTVPMLMSMGAACNCLVKKGDAVTVGMKIGDSDKFMSVPVHSPASGKVADIVDFVTANGQVCKAVVIETDGLQTICSDIKPPVIADRKGFLDAVRASGCCGLGGAGFPTHVKLSFDPQKTPVDTLVINGAECEPYITSDYREFMENGEDVAEGIKFIMNILDIPSCKVCIEENKPKATETMKKLTADINGVQVISLPMSYPQGAEKVIIHSATGRTVAEGELPSAQGVIVMNVSTVGFLMRYIKTGMPLVSRRITVDGSAVGERRGNYRVPIGTPACDIISFCGGEAVGEILCGGPMMGLSLADETRPLIKVNNAILAFKKPDEREASSCIRCGRCIRACPAGLMPVSLEGAYDRKDISELKRLKINLCINCGGCSYVCPAGRRLAEKNQLAKAYVQKSARSVKR